MNSFLLVESSHNDGGVDVADIEVAENAADISEEKRQRSLFHPSQ